MGNKKNLEEEALVRSPGPRVPEAEEALGVVRPEEEHGELWILKLNFPTLSTEQKV